MKTLMEGWIRLRNALDYPLRQLVRWRRGGYRPSVGSKEGLFNHLSPAEQVRALHLAQRLKSEYHLEDFERDSGPVNYRENLFYLHLLENALAQSNVDLPHPLLVADIGPSHWFYIQALHALLAYWREPKGRAVRIQGYEADAYRVYADLRSRLDHARGHIRGLCQVDYIPQAFTAQPGHFDLVVMLFPFVFERDHLEWGLPGKMFRPRDLLLSAWDSLKPGGTLLLVNQGAEEHRAESENFATLGIPVRAAFRQDPLLFSYDLVRWVLVSESKP